MASVQTVAAMADTQSPALVLHPKGSECRELDRRLVAQGFCSVGCSLPLPAPQAFPSRQAATTRILYSRTYATPNSLRTSVSQRRLLVVQPYRGPHEGYLDAMSSRTSVSAPDRVRKRVAEACAFCRRRKVCSTHNTNTAVTESRRSSAAPKGPRARHARHTTRYAAMRAAVTRPMPPAPGSPGYPCP